MSQTNTTPDPSFLRENPFEYKSAPQVSGFDSTSTATSTSNPFSNTAQNPEPISVPASASSEPAYQEQSQQQQQPAYDEQSSLIPGFTKPIREEILLEWHAPVRPYKPQNRQVFTTIGVIGLLIGLILFFAGQLLPVAVVFATIFLVYVMYSTPPSLALNKLTTYGIRVENTLYYWEEMGRFWFTRKFDTDILHIEIGRFPNRLTLLLSDIPKEDMEAILSEVLIQEVPPPTAYEKVAQWLHEKIPIAIE